VKTAMVSKVLKVSICSRQKDRRSEWNSGH